MTDYGENTTNSLYDSFENEKERYIAVLKSNRFSNEPVQSQKIFIQHYMAMFPGKRIHQSTVSENFDSFSIEKIDGVYKYNPNYQPKIKANGYFITNLVKNISDVSEETLCHFKINTAVGSEYFLAKILYNIAISEFNVTIIPAIGSVIIQSIDNNSILKFKKRISTYIRKFSE